ncbi:MAG: DUF4440 domain-containing protein [Bacteroidetes bacterium]|nr:DUF4440 domain-containing protein [Bacteroidota bacterium]
MLNKLIFTTIVVFANLYSQAQSADEKQIRTSMNEQMEAWNRGDINRFMETYWQNDSLMFIGKNGVTYGWGPTKQSYIKGYPDTTAMGKLDFTILEVKRLSVLYFFVVGKWHLTRSVGNLEGHFSLLFKKVKGRWVIVADHSS